MKTAKDIRKNKLTRRELCDCHRRIWQFKAMKPAEELVALHKKLETITNPTLRSDCLKYIGAIALKLPTHHATTR